MDGDAWARLTHELDQLQATLRDLSPLLAAFKEQLLSDGFTDEQAFRLTRDLLELLYTEANRNPPDDIPGL